LLGANEVAFAQTPSGRKLMHLEAARGIASIIVIFHHFALAFAPWLKGSFLEGGVKYTPLFALLNGQGAVMFFFVLSGFVLSYQFFCRPTANALERSVIKRIPRLMIPASVTIFFGLFILKALPANYVAAGQITSSDWLSGFASAEFPQNFAPSILSAVKQCLFVFILPHNSYYNTNLWTMANEFYGSMIVFFLCAASRWLSRTGFLSLMATLSAVCVVAHAAFVPFIAGCSLAYYQSRGHRWRISRRAISVTIVAVATVCFSTERWYFQVAASVILMLLLLGDDKVAERLSGQIGSILGSLSFPIYLVHTLVIVSISSSLFLWLHGQQIAYSVMLVLTLIVTIVASVLLSLPLILLEKIWVPFLNSVIKKVSFPWTFPQNSCASAPPDEIASCAIPTTSRPIKPPSRRSSGA